jgi:hypothetical protein
MKSEMRIQIIAIMLLCAVISVGCSDKIFYESKTTGSIVGKVVQSDSGAEVTVSQGVPVDSTSIDPANGMFRFDELPAGNYVLEIETAEFSLHTIPNVVVDGGRVTYVGEIPLSKTPAVVLSYYPENRSEIVLEKRDNWSNLFISIRFSREMDRKSVEEALSIIPSVEGTFEWNTYGTYWWGGEFRSDATGGTVREGAQITTYSHINSFTFRFSPKSSFSDTTYYVTLSTAACDTAGNHLDLPLQFSFKTIQASYSLPYIQTDPYDGQMDVPLICLNGIRITFPKRMKKNSVEELLTISPDTDPTLIWPEDNQLTIWTGGLLMADTTYTIKIDGSALDLDGEQLGEDFEFSFTTQPVQVVSTTPRKGELFVDFESGIMEIIIQFNTWMSKESVKKAFEIEPEVSGTFSFVERKEYRHGKEYTVIEKDKIKFVPGRRLLPNTKYIVTLDAVAVDLYGAKLTPYTFSFITRPE